MPWLSRAVFWGYSVFLWHRVVPRIRCESACRPCFLNTELFGKTIKTGKNKRKEPCALQELNEKPLGKKELMQKQKNNYVQEVGQAKSKQKVLSGHCSEIQKEKIQKDKKQNKKNLISCRKSWLWLWLWLSLATPVASTYHDSVQRDGILFQSPGPPRAPTGDNSWDWKVPWKQLSELERIRSRAVGNTFAGRTSDGGTKGCIGNCTFVTTSNTANTSDEMSEHPLNSLGFLFGLGILGVFWDWLSSPSCGSQVHVYRRKRTKSKPAAVSRQNLKRWALNTQNSHRVIFSSRWIGQQRHARSMRECKQLCRFIWWCPQTYRHRGQPLRVLIPDTWNPQNMFEPVPILTDPPAGRFVAASGTGFSQGSLLRNRWLLSGGAGGQSARDRKRKQHSQGPQPSLEALTEFLDTWDKKQEPRHETSPEPPTTKRPKTDTSNYRNGSFSQSNSDSSLARELIQVLKQCLNQGKSDSQVVSQVKSTVEKFSNTHWGSGGSTSRWNESDWWIWGASCSQRSFEPPQSRSVVFQNSQERKPMVCASYVDSAQWVDAKLTSFNQIQKAFSEGTALPGNLIVTKNEQLVDEVRMLFDAHDCKTPFTVAVASGNSASPAVSVWWTSGPQRLHRPSSTKLELHQFGSSQGTTVRPPKVVSLPGKSGPPLVTLRILVPDFYRKGIVQHPMILQKASFVNLLKSLILRFPC